MAVAAQGDLEPMAETQGKVLTDNADAEGNGFIDIVIGWASKCA